VLALAQGLPRTGWTRGVGRRSGHTGGLVPIGIPTATGAFLLMSAQEQLSHTKISRPQEIDHCAAVPTYHFEGKKTTLTNDTRWHEA